MDNVFAFLLLISLIGLAWGLARPRHLGRTLHISKPLTRRHTGVVLGGLVLLFFVLTGAAAPPEQPVASHTTAPQTMQTKPQVQADSIVTKQEVDTQSVPYATKTQDDSNLPQGQTKIVQAGVNGIETLTYNVTYTNGQQTAKTLVSDTVTSQPTPEIIASGTYVAPAPVIVPTPTPAPAPAPAPSPSCYPLTNGGNCYEPGEYCRNSDHGLTGIAGDGEAIVCAYNNGWRWEPQN